MANSTHPLEKFTVGRYLTQRLEELGLKHIFGIPGDYVLRLFDYFVDSNIEIIQTCDEQGSGFAADAYARVNGLSALCVTYCVGGLKTVNPVAGGYAEKAPMIVISGAPGLNERAHSRLLHHKVKDFHTQLQVYKKVTVQAVSIDDILDAPRRIDECLVACLQSKRPVYLEFPRDMVDQICEPPGILHRTKPQSDPAVLGEALAEATDRLRSAKHPVILGGVEIHRYQLQHALLNLVECSGMPVATTILGKSIISELHPQYLGIYEGAMGREEVRQRVESADCILILGAFMTDINLGVYTANLDIERTINAFSERIDISRHHYEGIVLEDFINGLSKSGLGAHTNPVPRHSNAAANYRPNRQAPIRVKRFFDRMESFIVDGMMVICDIGDSLFGAADLTMHHETEFISPAYYTSMGYAVPAALGAQINRRDWRPVVFVGDGAFQMTGQELSSLARYDLNPIIFVLNNRGYTTERFIHDGPYNDVYEWAYHRMPSLLRKGWGCEVKTEGELEDALIQAKANLQSYSIINVHLGKFDHSEALARLGQRLGARVESSPR